MKVFTKHFLTLCLVSMANTCLGCYCINHKYFSSRAEERIDVQNSLSDADMVISGKVIEINPVKRLNEEDEEWILDQKHADLWRLAFNLDDILQIKIKIQKKVKGKIKSRFINVYTYPDPSTCGFPFEMNKSYMVYGYVEKIMSRQDRLRKNDEWYWTNICLRTTSEVKREKAFIRENRHQTKRGIQ